MGTGEPQKKPIYPFRMSNKTRTETGLRLADRQPTNDAVIALWDWDYGFVLHYYQPVALFCRQKAMVVRDDYIAATCQTPDELFLGDFQLIDGHAELRFEEKPYRSALLVELLCRTFGWYSPLKAEAARIYDHNPTVFCGAQLLGTLKEIVAKHLHNSGQIEMIQ